MKGYRSWFFGTSRITGPYFLHMLFPTERWIQLQPPFCTQIMANPIPFFHVCWETVLIVRHKIKCGWMANVQGANAALAHHKKSLKRDQLSTYCLGNWTVKHECICQFFVTDSHLFKVTSRRCKIPIGPLFLSNLVSAIIGKKRWLTERRIINIIMKYIFLIEESSSVRFEQDVLNVNRSCLSLKG